MELFSEAPKTEYEAKREHTAFEAAKNLTRNLEYIKRTLEEREEAGFNSVLSEEALAKLKELASGGDMLSAQRSVLKEEVLSMLETFAQCVDALGRAPQERVFKDSAENLSALGMSLSNMEQLIDPIFNYVDSLDLSGEEKESALRLRTTLKDAISIRARFFAQKLKFLRQYLHQ
jgi:hypothetical protein